MGYRDYYFTAAKIVKIKKAIKAAGGVRKAAKGIIAAIKASKKLGGKCGQKLNGQTLARDWQDSAQI